jgi:hypothetical protein
MMTADRRRLTLQVLLVVWVAIAIVAAGALPLFESGLARLCGAP